MKTLGNELFEVGRAIQTNFDFTAYCRREIWIFDKYTVQRLPGNRGIKGGDLIQVPGL